MGVSCLRWSPSFWQTCSILWAIIGPSSTKDFLLKKGLRASRRSRWRSCSIIPSTEKGTFGVMVWKPYLFRRRYDGAYIASKKPTSLTWISHGVIRTIGPTKDKILSVRWGRDDTNPIPHVDLLSYRQIYQALWRRRKIHTRKSTQPALGRECEQVNLERVC